MYFTFKLVVFLPIFMFMFFTFSPGCEAFDTTLDTEKHTIRWKFEGPYVYAQSLKDIQDLSPRLLASSPVKSDPEDKHGIWLTKHVHDGKNEWNMSTSLSHLLFVQGWVTYLADPSVPLVIKSSNSEVGRFWSDGKTWCDAIFNLNYNNVFKAEITTPKLGDYAMVDKVVLGVMANITALKKRTNLNPCQTSLPNLDDEKPDMEVKPTEESNAFRRRTTDEGLPHMDNKKQSMTNRPTPSETPSTRTYQTETGGAKCDCVCSCKKPNNTTYLTTTMPPTTPI